MKQTCLTPLSADLLRFFRAHYAPKMRDILQYEETRESSRSSPRPVREERRGEGVEAQTARCRAVDPLAHTQTNHYSAGIKAEIKHLFFSLVRQNFHFLQAYFPQLSWKLVFLKWTTIKE